VPIAGIKLQGDSGDIVALIFKTSP
jgi:hypothetical protein